MNQEVKVLNHSCSSDKSSGHGVFNTNVARRRRDLSLAAKALCTVGFLSFGALAIEANFKWARQAGGIGLFHYVANAEIAIDRFNQSYVAGSFGGTVAFDESHIFNPASGGAAFVAKYDHNGKLLWANATDGNAFASAITVDENGNCYVTGYFESDTDFGGVTLTNQGGMNAFVAKYDSAGMLLWARQAVGNPSHSFDQGVGISADSTNGCYVTGFFWSYVTFGNVTLTSGANGGGPDAFIVKYDANGNVNWAHQAGGFQGAIGYRITRHSPSEIYMSGTFRGSIPLGNVTLTNSPPNEPVTGGIFLAKMNETGDFVWAKAGTTVFSGPTANSQNAGYSLATTPSGQVYLTGAFGAPVVSFDSHALTNSSGPGSADGFCVAYGGDGTFRWLKHLSGASNDVGRAVATDGAGNLYWCGYFAGSAVLDGNVLTNPQSQSDSSFVAKFSPAGDFMWAKAIDSTGELAANTVSADMAGNCYVAGYFNGMVNFGATVLTNSGGLDLFLASMGADLPPLSIRRVGNNAAITWPTNCPSVVLETISSLSDTNWSPITNQPGLWGVDNVITNDLSMPRQFFRLRNQ